MEGELTSTCIHSPRALSTLPNPRRTSPIVQKPLPSYKTIVRARDKRLLDNQPTNHTPKANPIVAKHVVSKVVLQTPWLGHCREPCFHQCKYRLLSPDNITVLTTNRALMSLRSSHRGQSDESPWCRSCTWPASWKPASSLLLLLLGPLLPPPSAAALSPTKSKATSLLLQRGPPPSPPSAAALFPTGAKPTSYLARNQPTTTERDSG